jgi:hypothetical protein
LITKAAYEETFRTVQFRRPDGQGPLNESETLVSASVSCAAAKTGEDATAAMLSDVATYDETQVRYLLKGGTAGTEYLLSVRVATSNGQKFEERLALKVT